MVGETCPLECPMCDFAVLPTDDYFLQLHFEQVHTTDSPFRTEDGAESPPPALSTKPTPNSKYGGGTPSSDDEENNVMCPEPECGEIVLLIDFNEHLDYHAAETLSFDETTGKYHSRNSSTTMQDSSAYMNDSFANYSLTTNVPEASRKHDSHRHNKSRKHSHRERSNTNSSEKSTLARSIISFNPFSKLEKSVKPPNSSARLGKSELGPHAYENRMPDWLHSQLAAGPKITVINRIGRDGRLIKQEQVQNETPGLMPILAQLSALDPSVKEAYYCHPSTLHVGKTPREGGFCGYRNLQMLLSYIQGAKAQGHEEFPGRTPGILQLQDLIERAWDKDINSIGRIQTGGIRDTRKYIGTPEAQAFCLSSEINCAVEMFSDNKELEVEAHETLLDAIERYFAQAAVKDSSTVCRTLLPPIYLQQPGHSITIVGFERRRDGTCNLMVFDPMYSTSPAMHKLLGRKSIRTARPEVLHAYRRGAKQLKKHAAFEILMLTATPPLFPAWDVLRQFPDCRFVYAFFRSRTLGYDVYPEDYFLSNFPWQQYGGLWVCDEARFARSKAMNKRSAQALRLITGEGSSYSSSSNSPTSPFTNSGFRHLSATSAHPREEVHTQVLPFVPSLDGSTSNYLNTIQNNGSGVAFKTAVPHFSLLSTDFVRPNLSLLTDVGRRYPGFPTPLSPTLSAKGLFPSPASEVGSNVMTPRATSPAVLSVSPMSIDGSFSTSLIDSIIAENIAQSSPLSPLPTDLLLRTPSTTSQSRTNTTSPPHIMSPRMAMLKNIIDKQAFQTLSHNPLTYPAPGLEYHPKAMNCISSSSSPASLCRAPYIKIANGTETSTTSPISPTGTVLAYTSHRPVDSGLLGVQPLSETQVAEYRFWRPCGKRACAFGCGGAHEGEWAAAKRLFKEAEDVSYKHERDGARGRFGLDGQSAPSEGDRCDDGSYKASVWAGRRMVTNWNQFLVGCEREGVAKF
ncbi:peptidase family C78-domain-containing protein [Phaeosphaeriaceae sp. PMI808]|nr:peptidase family C78-domain-containing protein [Phaeosphaeriaceae sp. PMI808]